MIFGSAKKYIYKFTNRKEKERRKRVKGGREEGREGKKNCQVWRTAREKSLIGDH